MTGFTFRFDGANAWNINSGAGVYAIVVIAPNKDNSLDARKKINQKLSSEYNDARAREFGADYRKHTINHVLNDATLTRDTFAWETASTAERAEMFPRFVNACASYRFEYSYNPVKTKIKSYHPKNKNAAASAGNGTVTAYQHIINCNDVNRVWETAGHEVDHLFQPAGKSTIGQDAVKVAGENYIQPHEDEQLYRDNILEKEAYTVGRIVGHRFKETLAAMCKTR